MWRPFASDFVGNTYMEYRKKMDKIWSAKPIKVREAPSSFDVNALFPFKFKDEDLSQRRKEFEQLKNKVEKQRKEIKQKEEEKIISERLKINAQMRETQKSKEQRRKSLIRLRSMASNKIHRIHPSRSVEHGEKVFNFTQLTSNTFIKNGTLNRRSTFK